MIACVEAYPGLEICIWMSGKAIACASCGCGPPRVLYVFDEGEVG